MGKKSALARALAAVAGAPLVVAREDQVVERLPDGFHVVMEQQQTRLDTGLLVDACKKGAISEEELQAILNKEAATF